MRRSEVTIINHFCPLHCNNSVLAFHLLIFSNVKPPTNSRLAGSDTKEDIQKIFELFDDDKTGYISLQNLKRVCFC